MSTQRASTADPLRVLTRAQRNQAKALSPVERQRHAVRFGVLLVAAAVAVLLSWRLLVGLTPIFRAWLSQASALQCGVVVLAAMLLAALLAQRTRQAMQLSHARSWLAVAPIAPRILDRYHRAQFIKRFAIGVTLTAAALTVLLVGVDATAPLLTIALVSLLAAAAFGAGIGWFFAGRASQRRRRVDVNRKAKARVAPAVHGRGAAALARWPTARLAERCSGHHLARLLLPVFVLLPGNIGGAAALMVITFCVAIIVAVEMWLALRDIVPRAAAWLQSTPLPARRFVWLLAQRALGVWAILALLFGGASVLMGLPLRGALQGGLLIVAAGAASAALFLRRRNAPTLLDNSALAQVLAVAAAGLVGVPPLIAALAVVAVINFKRAVQT